MGRIGRPKGVRPMTGKQLNGYLELIAKLLEARGYPEAAEIVRDAKI